MDHGQGEFPFVEILAERLAYDFLFSHEVEQIILYLECHAEGYARAVEGFGDLIVGTGEFGAQPTAFSDEGCGFAADDLEVGAFIEAVIVAVMKLGEFAFAEGVGDFSQGEADGGIAGG